MGEIDSLESSEWTDWSAAENLERVCRSILINTRNELYLKMRFLDVALSSFFYVIDMDIYQMGTDGFGMHYQPLPRTLLMMSSFTLF